MTKTVPCGNELHKFLIWDTAGQERVSITLQRMFVILISLMHLSTFFFLIKVFVFRRLCKCKVESLQGSAIAIKYVPISHLGKVQRQTDHTSDLKGSHGFQLWFHDQAMWMLPVSIH